ncbi:MAG TPA: hypothetical protein VJX92_12180 [Methylomirabilota bacterium]|nr:hypothetical protein [Methylomirabilota bacterium]
MIRALALLLLLPSVATLPAVAYASPPDPSWIQGIFDGADYDDVVVLVAATVALSDTFLDVALWPSRPLIGNAPQFEGSLGSTPPLSPLQPRAPPAR